MSIENLYTPNCIRTHSGRYFDPFNPDPALIEIEDIAIGLSRIPRFAGHTKRFYSVLSHSISVWAMVPKEHHMAALLHDASEAYIFDMPSPIKSRLPDYKKLEFGLMSAIAEKFGFQYPLHPEVAAADLKCLEIEWDGCVLDDRAFINWEPYEFIRIFNSIPRS